MGIDYHLTLLLHLMMIEDLMIGHHMVIASSLRLPTFYSAKIRCPPQISTFYSASGGHLLLPMAVYHRFWRLHICTKPLIPLLLVALHGNLSAYSIMDPSQKIMFHLGCKLNTMFGSVIHALWSTTSCPITISSLILIMHHFKSAQLMDSIAFMTSCLRIGPGIKL